MLFGEVSKFSITFVLCIFTVSLSGEVSKFSITFVLCIFPDSASYLASRVLRDRCQSKSESGLTFCEIHFSLVFDLWTTTPTPPSELTDGSVATGCTTPAFPLCSGTCYTTLATRGPPHTMVARTVSSGLGAARSTWTSQLTPLTQPLWFGSPRLGATTSTTL
jgi:hypothetical protein